MIILDSVGKHQLPGRSTVFMNFVVKISRRKNNFFGEDSFRKWESPFQLQWWGNTVLTTLRKTKKIQMTTVQK